jgi:hypothetical protein
MRKGAAIIVEQHPNPNYCEAQVAEDQRDFVRCIYRVKEMVNTTAVFIGEWLSRGQVQDLISSGNRVTIKGPANARPHKN